MAQLKKKNISIGTSNTNKSMKVIWGGHFHTKGVRMIKPKLKLKIFYYSLTLVTLIKKTIVILKLQGHSIKTL